MRLELRAAAIRDFDEEDAGAGFDAPEPTIGQETAQWEIHAHLCSPTQGRQVLSASMETTGMKELHLAEVVILLLLMSVTDTTER